MAQRGIQAINSAASGAAAHPVTDVRRVAMTQRLGRRLDPQDPATARFAAGRMVSELFFKPLLAELREQSWGAPFIDGGQTESIFGEQLDQKLADTVASKQTGLVDEIAAKLKQRPAGFDQATWRTRLQAGATGISR